LWVLQQANNAGQPNGKAKQNGKANSGQQTKYTKPVGTGPINQPLWESNIRRAYSPSAEQVPEPHPKDIPIVAPTVVAPAEEKAPEAAGEGVKKKKGRKRTKRTPPPPGETKAERKKRKKARRAIKKAEKLKFKAEQRAIKAKAAAVSFIHTGPTFHLNETYVIVA
jgi:hypothetical protein